jgi:hypothetical protein
LAQSKKRTRNVTLPRVTKDVHTRAPEFVDLTSADSPPPAKRVSNMAAVAGIPLGYTLPPQTVKGPLELVVAPASKYSDAENLKLLQSQGRTNSDTQTVYLSLFGVFQRYCAEHERDQFVFDIELAYLFAAYMLSRITRSGGPVVTIANYCTAFNFVYDKKKLGRPWSGGEMTELITSYASASQLRSADLGVEVASMRIATPAVGIAHMMRLLNDATGDLLCWLATFTIMLLFWFRSDTMGGVQRGDSDIYFNSEGYLCFVVRRVKRGTAHIRAFVKSIAPPDAANDLRCMIWKKLKIALQVMGPDGTRLIGPQLWGDDPKRVSDVVTRKMKELLNCRDMGVALGTFISSHSWRKCGASAAARLQIDWHTVMCWGMWVSHASAEKYVDHKYMWDRILASLFDFLMNVTKPQLSFLSDTNWRGYDGHIDMADDGVFEMGKLDIS